MNVIKVSAQNPDPEAIRTAADAIRRGELVIFPTETVYGLAADALDEIAVRRVFEVKGRFHALPLPVQIACADDLPMVASEVSETARKLAARFWPGPLTLVLPKSPAVSALVSAGADTVGVRVPDHPVALALLRELGRPIIATSANVSGREAPTNMADAVRDLGDAVAVALDAGESELKIASTVVDVTTHPPKVVRHGAISLADILEEVGQIENAAD